MRSNGWAKIGLMLAGGDGYAPYYREALEHGGVRAEIVADFNDLRAYDVLLLCGEGELTTGQANALLEWTGDGGSLVLSGSSWGLAELIGFQGRPTHLSQGTLQPSGDRLWPDRSMPIRFYGGKFHKHTSGWEIAVKTEGFPAALRRPYDKGQILYVAPHVGQTMALMQLGRSVECDLIGPNEPGTRLDDGILRAEDGIALNFSEDRVSVEGSDTPFFGFPHADALRELWVRAVVEAIESTGLRSLISWPWPNHAPGSAVISLECDQFDFDVLSRLQRTLTMFGCRATLMVAMPGFPADAYRHIRTWGHEVGFLFHTDNGSGWHEEKLGIQFTALGRLSGIAGINSARPIEGRWRGYTNFYDLCQTAGARLSLSKGGRQPGTQGFAFGTARPFFPLKRDGNPYLVAELPTTVYMPGVVTTDPASDFILAQTALRNGCYHIVFRPDTIDDPAGNASIRRTLSLAKQQRLEFMTAEEVYRFERARRQIKVMAKGIGSDTSLHVATEAEVVGLGLLIVGGKFEAESKGREMIVTPLARFGTTMHGLTVTLDAKQSVEISLRPVQSMAA
ncbi:MAG: hypothetical protein U0S12_10370 [Fimbriimonadales bacterium]